MKADLAKMARLEALLAGLLHYGTWLASGVTALGLILTLAGPHGLRPVGTGIVTAGIACFILLPVLRVVLMLFVFLRERDYRFVAIAALVLVIIVTGLGVGMVL